MLLLSYYLVTACSPSTSVVSEARRWLPSRFIRLHLISFLLSVHFEYRTRLLLLVRYVLASLSRYSSSQESD